MRSLLALLEISLGFKNTLKTTVGISLHDRIYEPLKPGWDLYYRIVLTTPFFVTTNNTGLPSVTTWGGDWLSGRESLCVIAVALLGQEH